MTLRLITGPRQSGKTTELIKQSRKYPNAIILCRSEATRANVEELAETFETDVRTATYYDFFNGRLRGEKLTVLIDNLGHFVQASVAANTSGVVREVTMTPYTMTNLYEKR